MVDEEKVVEPSADAFRHYGRGGKGSVAGSKEILFVCKPKARISFAVPKKELLAYEQL